MLPSRHSSSEGAIYVNVTVQPAETGISSKVPRFLKSPLFWDLILMIGICAIAVSAVKNPTNLSQKISFIGTGFLAVAIISLSNRKKLCDEIVLVSSMIRGQKEVEILPQEIAKGSLTLGTNLPSDNPDNKKEYAVLMINGLNMSGEELRRGVDGNYDSDVLNGSFDLEAASYWIARQRDAGKDVYIACAEDGEKNCLAVIAYYLAKTKVEEGCSVIIDPTDGEIIQAITDVTQKFPRMTCDADSAFQIIKKQVATADLDELDPDYDD